MTEKFDRREFLRRIGIAGITTYGLNLVGGDLFGLFNEAEAASRHTLAIASGRSPEEMVKRSIDALGGIGKFVKKGNSVVIKPNIAWARTPAQAANTNPKVLSAVIKLCQQAGARRITVVDHTCDNANLAFNLNGARKVCSDTRVRLLAPDNRNMYRRINIPKGKLLKSDECVKDVLDADVFINIPIAKVHSAASITASMKNLMGVNWDRGAWHSSKDLDQCIADFSTAVKPDLIILDAVRVLLTNGPKGPGETKDIGKIAASTDPVAIDSLAATFLGKDPKDIAHIKYAASMGIGEMSMSKLNVKKV